MYISKAIQDKKGKSWHYYPLSKNEWLYNPATSDAQRYKCKIWKSEKMLIKYIENTFFPYFEKID